MLTKDEKITIALEALKKLSQFGEGTHKDRKESSWESLETMQIELRERMDFAQERLEYISKN